MSLVPRWMKLALVVAVILSFVPLALIARARGMTSKLPRVQIQRHMGDQPSFKPQSVNTLFADGRAERPRVAGTVRRTSNPRGGDARYERGRDGAAWITDMPVTVDEAFIRRGQERFNIYCAPCHGMAGYGDGPIARRADQLQEGTWIPPTNLVSAQILARPNGHLYNTIANGIRTMPAYGNQVDVDDRWAIVAYLRALQLSQNARPGDLPADRR